MVMNNLGTMYMEGCGVNRSDRWAKYWFEKSVAHGYVFTMINLANMTKTKWIEFVMFFA